MTIDLRTGERYAPRLKDYCTRAAAVEPGGGCPIWRAFLERVTDRDRELQEYLKRVCGYWLTGHCYEHALFFFYGIGANGKSVLVETVQGYMGSYATTAPAETFMAVRGERHPTELAALRGARLVIAHETESGRHWNESRIKQLTGGDTVAARFMRQDFFTFKPTFKICIVGNHRPSLRTVDEAIRRRFHLIPFNVTIPKEERDPYLTEKLKTEWPGILAWAVEGCLEWHKIGLNPPKAVREATESYLSAEDSFETWIEECTCPASDWAFETSADLFTSWKVWAEKAGEEAGSRKRFADMLQSRGYPTKKGAKGVRVFEGIRLTRSDYTNDPRNGN
jgi:putative DNA primase/helicase